jgi:hypothetical protein
VAPGEAALARQLPEAAAGEARSDRSNQIFRFLQRLCRRDGNLSHNQMVHVLLRHHYRLRTAGQASDLGLCGRFAAGFAWRGLRPAGAAGSRSSQLLTSHETKKNSDSERLFFEFSIVFKDGGQTSIARRKKGPKHSSSISPKTKNVRYRGN